MKKRMLTIVLVAVLILSLSACGNNQDKTYSKEDFQSIVIGESTIKDVHKIAPRDVMSVTSFGGEYEYPTENGGKIRISFYGEDLVVGSIEEIPPSEN